MKFLLPLVFTVIAASRSVFPRQQDDRDTAIIRNGSVLLLNDKPWKAVGPNIYWLGLDENVTPPAGAPYHAPSKASYPTKGRITEAMAIVKAMGGTAIRAHTLGVSTGNPLSLMPALDTVNEAAFETIDWAVYQARAYGLRLMIPLTDNWDYYHGGKYNFLHWHGINLTQNTGARDPVRLQQFYTNQKIVASFKNYIKILLTHVNPLTNLTYAEDPTIFAYETGNELSGPVFGDMDVPASWIEDIGSYVKSLGPKKLFVDGTAGVSSAHLAINSVDIFTDHFYPVDIARLQKGLARVATVKKSYFVGEYEWSGKDLTQWLKVIEDSPYAIGNVFWSLFGRNLPDCSTWVDHSDGHTMKYGFPGNSDLITSRMKQLRQHFIKMTRGETISANATLPLVPCPAPTAPPTRR